MPAERVSDLRERKLKQATLDETGRPNREKGNPLPFQARGGCQTMGKIIGKLNKD
jgi:hypothetical protein